MSQAVATFHRMTSESRYPPERLVEYDSAWTERFVETSTPLLTRLGPAWAVEHVGSTSVPGLPAKPVIDLALRLPEDERLRDWEPAFRSVGWTGLVKVGDHDTSFLLDGETRRAIAHVFTAQQWPEAHLRLFAHWLRTHQTAREEYANLKRALVSRGLWGSSYTAAKLAFVQRMVNEARAARDLPPVTLGPATNPAQPAASGGP